MIQIFFNKFLSGQISKENVGLEVIQNLFSGSGKNSPHQISLYCNGIPAASGFSLNNLKIQVN